MDSIGILLDEIAHGVTGKQEGWSLESLKYFGTVGYKITVYSPTLLMGVTDRMPSGDSFITFTGTDLLTILQQTLTWCKEN